MLGLEDGSINFLFANLDRLGQDDDTLLSLLEDHCYHHYSSYYSSSPLLSDFCVRSIDVMESALSRWL